MPPIMKERGPFASLLATQLAFILISPFIADQGIGGYLLQISIWAIFLAGLYAASAQRAHLKVAILLLVPAFVAWVLPDFFSERVDDTLRMLSAMACLLFTAFVVLRATMEHEVVTLDTILGGINAYLLLAFAYVFVYAALIEWQGDALAIAGTPLVEAVSNDPDKHGFATLLYFSFTTITSLGYGDIVPTTQIARLTSSVQAVTGQLYIAIFIGRLVGLEVARHARSS